MTREELISVLNSMSSESLRLFNEKITKGAKIIGIKIPELKKFSKNYLKENGLEILDEIEYEYLEETLFSGYLICFCKENIEKKLELLKIYAKNIKNWNECDSICSAFKPKNEEKEVLWHFIEPYFYKKGEFEKRFAIVMALDNFLDDGHIDDILAVIQNVESGQYNVDMALGWLLSMSFVKYKDKTVEVLKNNKLSKNVAKITLSKIRDSLQVSKKEKSEVKELIQSIYGGK